MRHILLGIALILIATSVIAPITCTTRPACQLGEVAVYSLSTPINAHGAHGTSFPNHICCTAEEGVLSVSSTACTTNTVGGLSSLTNAHGSFVPDATGAFDLTSAQNYTNLSCINSSNGTVECGLVDTALVPNPPGTCVATLSNQQNAHLAACDSSTPFPLKVFCTLTDLVVDSDLDFDVTITPTPLPEGGQLVISIVITNTAGGLQGAEQTTLHLAEDSISLAPGDLEIEIQIIDILSGNVLVESTTLQAPPAPGDSVALSFGADDIPTAGLRQGNYQIAITITDTDSGNVVFSKTQIVSILAQAGATTVPEIHPLLVLFLIASVLVVLTRTSRDST